MRNYRSYGCSHSDSRRIPVSLAYVLSCDGPVSGFLVGPLFNFHVRVCSTVSLRHWHKPFSNVHRAPRGTLSATMQSEIEKWFDIRLDDDTNFAYLPQSCFSSVAFLQSFWISQTIFNGMHSGLSLLTRLFVPWKSTMHRCFLMERHSPSDKSFEATKRTVIT